MKNILTFALIAVSLIGFSQTTDAEADLKKQNVDSVQGWKKGGFFNLSFGQVALSNWVGGGTNSISTNAIVNVYANYTKGKLSWDNTLNLSYGVIKQGASSAPWIKNDDKIEFSSKLGRKLKKNTYGAILLNFKSQFTAGYETETQTNLISKFAAPGYLIGAVGVDHHRGPFSIFVAPVTLKTTLVGLQNLADQGLYGVEAATFDALGAKLKDGKTVRNEIGGYVRLLFKKDFSKTIAVESKVDLFSNYIDNPQNIDVNWDLLIAMKINKYLTTTITTNLIYDNDIMIAIDSNGDGVKDSSGPRVQFKEVFGLGLSYKF